MKRLVWVFAAALAGCTPPESSGVKVIVGARLIAAPGRTPVEYSVVVVESGRFREVGPQSSTPVPKGAQITRGMGLTIESSPAGGPIEPGRSADLILKGQIPQRQIPQREMRHGEWVN